MCETKTKVCSKCGEEKPMTLEFFMGEKRNKSGISACCRICHNKRTSEWRKSNPDKMKNYQVIYKEEGISKKYSKKWRDNNTHYFRKRDKKLRRIDPLYRVKKNIKGRIYKSLVGLHITKDKRTWEIVGCSPEFFVSYLELKFLEGMTWENYGPDWHIDHIIPIASAKTEEDVERLNHYTNLQPLWAEDNLKKSDKISEEWGNLENTSNTSIR